MHHHNALTHARGQSPSPAWICKRTKQRCPTYGERAFTARLAEVFSRNQHIAESECSCDSVREAGASARFEASYSVTLAITWLVGDPAGHAQTSRDSRGRRCCGVDPCRNPPVTTSGVAVPRPRRHTSVPTRPPVEAGAVEGVAHVVPLTSSSWLNRSSCGALWSLSGRGAVA